MKDIIIKVVLAVVAFAVALGVSKFLFELIYYSDMPSWIKYFC